MKRVLLIIASIIVLAGVGVAIYFLFFAADKPTLTGVTNPFDGTPSDRTPVDTDTNTGGTIQGAGEVVAPRLLKLADGPVAKGAAVLFVPGTQPAAVTLGSTTATSSKSDLIPVGTAPDVEVRFIERQSGNVYSFRVHDRILTRLSNKTLPGVQEASWVPNGSRAFLRFLEKGSDTTEHIDTYAMTPDGTSGYFLEQDLSQVLTSSSTVLSLLPSSAGSIATLSNPDGTGAHTFFSSTLSALSLGLSGTNVIATTRAAATSDGYAFSIPLKTGVFTRLLGPLPGLATLPSPDGKSLLYSFVYLGKLHSEVLDIATHAAVALPLATLSEKCVWQSDGRAIYCGIPTNISGVLPDDWYQGAKSFSDRIWKIDMETRTATLVVDPTQVGSVAVDAVALTLDPTNDVLVFTNKTDGSLWSYDL